MLVRLFYTVIFMEELGWDILELIQETDWYFPVQPLETLPSELNLHPLLLPGHVMDSCFLGNQSGAQFEESQFS